MQKRKLWSLGDVSEAIANTVVPDRDCHWGRVSESENHLKTRFWRLWSVPGAIANTVPL